MNRILTILILMAVFSSVCTAEITVSSDRNPVSLNESFKLTFDVTGSSGDDPDFSPLEKDFQILSTGQNSYFSMVNGQITSSKQWTLLLLANSTGKLQVPSIAFGSEHSPAVDIEVKDDSAAEVGKPDEYVYLEATASTLNPYVQSQVHYTLKLYRSVGIGKAQLGDPVVGEGTAVIERLDDDVTYDKVINGKTWQVIERNFAIYPQSSGKVTITPVSFMGQISGNSYGYDPFGPAPRTIIRRSGEVALDVRPIPSAFTGNHWLPATNLNIAEQWSVDPSSLKGGEPVTRTLTLNATGQTSSQLPEMPAWGLPDLKYYPDQPGLSDVKAATGITGTRTEKAAIIPNKPGTYALPEISVPWWNITTDKLEYAVVPEHTVQVMPGTGNTNVPVDVQQSQVQKPSVIESVAKPASKAEPAAEPVAVPQDSYWKWISITLLILWLSTLVYWWSGSRSGVQSAGAAPSTRGKPDGTVKQLLEACKRNDPQATRLLLLQWGRLTWPANPPFSLGDISTRTSNEMAAEITKLNDALYSRAGKDWTGDSLARVFSSESVRLVVKEKPADQGKLEPLYRI